MIEFGEMGSKLFSELISFLCAKHSFPTLCVSGLHISFNDSPLGSKEDVDNIAGSVLWNGDK